MNEPMNDLHADGRLLLYRVSGEVYGSLLSSLREVLDAPVDAASDGSPTIEGRRVISASLSALLGGESGAADASGVEQHALLVVGVSTPGSLSERREWVGLRVEGVLGMIRIGALYPVPDGITALPEGTILGAILFEERDLRVSEETTAEERDAEEGLRGDVRWRLDESRIAPIASTDSTRRTDDDDDGERWEMVIVLDLEPLAREVLAANVG